MPPKKKPKANGFAIFMQSKKRELEAQGQRFPLGLGDPKLQAKCSSLWQEMSEEQQSVYKMRAKQGHSDFQGRAEPTKYDSKGVPLAFKEREEQAKVMVKTEMWNSIQEMVSNLHQRRELISYEFHFGHLNYLVNTDQKDNEWLPCEVAIVKFSLVSGITEHYHQFIDPGPPPVGWAFAAKDHSQLTHKINPATGFDRGSKDYVSVVANIRRLLATPDGRMAPLYVLEAHIPETQSMLQWLLEKSAFDDEPTEMFRVFNLNKLLYEVRKHADLNNPRLVFPTMLMVERKLLSNVFDFSPNMACEWHENEDNSRHCSLTSARRYAYIIADLCCDGYKLRLLPNCHVPADQGDETKYRVEPRPSPAAAAAAAVAAHQQPAWHQDPVVTERRPEPAEAAMRYPRSAAGSSSVGSGVGPRLAARFDARGVATSPTPSMASTVSTASTSKPIGRGRGRGLLAPF